MLVLSTSGENAITSIVVILFPGQVLVVVARQRSRLEPTGTTAASVTGPVRECDSWSLFLFANLRGTVSGSLWRGADVNYARAVDFCARDVTSADFCCREVSSSLLAALPGLALGSEPVGVMCCGETHGYGNFAAFRWHTAGLF